MADYNARIAPFIDITFYVTSVFGIQETRTHRGLDIATATSAGNVSMYSMCNGTVIRNRWDDSYGNYLILKDNDSGIGFLFAHMNEPSPLAEGENVVIGQYIGDEGTTGNSMQNNSRTRSSRGFATGLKKTARDAMRLSASRAARTPRRLRHCVPKHSVLTASSAF